MFSIISKIVAYKEILLIAALVLVVSNGITGILAYRHGMDVKEAEYAAASQKAAEKASLANSAAVGRELEDVVRRVQEHTEINSEIEASHDESDDATAPPAFQLVFDRLRRIDGEKRRD